MRAQQGARTGMCAHLALIAVPLLAALVLGQMERKRPSGRYEKTQPVRIESVRQNASSPERHVRLSCPTEGASIGYTTETGPEARWSLYSQPLEFREPVTLRAKAIRYGYVESDETRRTLA